MKAPLNLLQGFNILSEDSLNNFITIINRTFDYRFESAFEHGDYLEVISNIFSESFSTIKFEEVVGKAECEIYGEQTVNGESVKYDIEKLFNDIVSYLETNNIPFSRNDKYYSERTVCVVANGVKMIYRKETPTTGVNRSSYDNCAKISFSVSPYNFLKAFTLLKNLLQLFGDKETAYIRLHLKERFSYITMDEDGSSILSSYPEFEVDKSYIGGYVCNELGVKIYIFDHNKHERNHQPDYVASVVFDRDCIQTENIIKLVDKLYDIGFIFEK